MKRAVLGRTGFRLLIAGMLVSLLGCPRAGVIDDGTSVSWGPSNRGKLVRATELPRAGEGFEIRPLWWRRGMRYATDEMVDLIVHVGRRLERESPGARLGVGDLSRRHGGPTPWHRSHQTGRDVDFVFFATDMRGRPFHTQGMPAFAADGTSTRASRPLRFDVERNWLLIKALIENPVARVQYVFVSDDLKQLLLDHALAAGEPESLVEQASYILHQPTDTLKHDDHFHVRIYCSRSDRVAGCRDRGTLRWTKKGYKYVSKVLARRATLDRSATVRAPVRAMLALGAVPF